MSLTSATGTTDKVSWTPGCSPQADSAPSPASYTIHLWLPSKWALAGSFDQVLHPEASLCTMSMWVFQFRAEGNSDYLQFLFWLLSFTMLCFPLLSRAKLNQNLRSKCPSAVHRCLLHGTGQELFWSEGTIKRQLGPQQLFCSTYPLLLVLITCWSRAFQTILMCFWEWRRWLCS